VTELGLIFVLVVKAFDSVVSAIALIVLRAPVGLCELA
jgi:hypothetical protein